MSQRSASSPADAHRARVASVVGAAAGLLTGLGCTGSMILAALGVIGAAAASGSPSMSGMGGIHHGAARTSGEGIGRFLVDHGPSIFIVSIIPVTVTLLLRRRTVSAAIAAATGGLMYWGMYIQSDVPVMYLTIAAGFVAWLALLTGARLWRLPVVNDSSHHLLDR